MSIALHYMFVSSIYGMMRKEGVDIDDENKQYINP
jgi:hypothetical protein